MSIIDDSEIQKIVVGRVQPHIYSFETNTLPNYLKVGDTYRPVEERLNEWRRYYQDLNEVSRHPATISDGVFFRDHSVHKYFSLNRINRLQIDRDNGVYSTEFFENASKSDVNAAIDDVIENYNKTDKYEYYNNLKERVERHWIREANFVPRYNQQVVIDNFDKALKNGRTNLLMYAVMRFGKSITSMWCAKKIDSKFTVIVSAKADVRTEWKQTVESHIDFTGYRFVDSSDLKAGLNIDDLYGQTFKTGNGTDEVCTNVVLFLTLQDLAGSSDSIKIHHKILQTATVNLLIIDETHFGARAQVLGKILAGVDLSEVEKEYLNKKEEDTDLGSINKLKGINSQIKIHLSGTPYRILMGSEFEQDDVIAFVQFSDIYEAKLDWSRKNLDEDEWKNPYYGFPQMVRFAFNPNESSRKVLSKIYGSKPSELFTPIKITKSAKDYEVFAYEKEVTDLLQALDGTKIDTEMLGLLDNETIKAGKLARHIVMVLPYRASCDALEKLIINNKSIFKNLSQYKIINISGFNKILKTPDEIKGSIIKAENEGMKTITLTVNKMLTGTTVPQWDTMIYLKGTSSPQEYDQAIFRLQSPWVETYHDGSGDVIKFDMKPQTLLVDLDLTRLFYLQEMKAYIYGANTKNIGNENINTFIERELSISPIITLNAEKNKLVETSAAKIMDEVRKYASERSISEDVREIGIDLNLKDNPEVFDFISRLSELGSRNGINIRPAEEEGNDLDEGAVTPNEEHEENNSTPSSSSRSSDDEDASSFEKQFRTFYVMILLFAFLTNTSEKSLTDIINNLDSNEDNKRIAKNLGLKKEDLSLIRDNINWSVLSALDYKIQNSDFRSDDNSLTFEEHIDKAIHKFGKLSDSEVFTPAHIVDKIYDSFDDIFWTNVASSNVLDIASKSGSFARGYIKRVLRHGTPLDTVKDNFYSIPTSTAAYEFTRKMYSALGLNTSNIAQHFTSYDILELKHPSAITNLLQIKTLSEITKHDLADMSDKIETDESEGNLVKFSAIVGNPPYQANIEGRGDQPPIYNLFLEEAYKLSDKVAIIHPARFLFNAGLTPKPWNKKMLQDPHLKVEYFEQKSSNIFPNTDIKGGIAITYRDANQDFGAIDVFTSFPKLNSILHKVESKGEQTLYGEITGRGVYRLTNKALNDRPEIVNLQSEGHKTDVGSGAFKILRNVVLFDSKPKDGAEYVRVIGLHDGKRKYLWIKRDHLSSPRNFEKYKIIIPKANGSGAIGEVLSSPLIGGPLIGYTETFIGLGVYDSKEEAEAALKYIKSKFARTMLGILKITQDNPRDKWAKVPAQDFTEASEIDWSKSVVNIDRQLYAKYGLDESEINFIESHVKAME